MLCNAGTLSGVPETAVVTTTATGTNPTLAAGTAPRQFQANVKLVVQSEPSTGAAVFAGGGLLAANGGVVEPLDPAEHAQVWIEAQYANYTWQCSNSYAIDGDVIVPDGGANLANTCHITGDLWVRDNFTATNSARVDGNTTVFSGNASAYNSAYFGGDVSIGGYVTDTWSWVHGPTFVGAVCTNGTSDNIPSCASAFPTYAKKGLPEVDFHPSDWPSTFVVKDLNDFAQDVVAGAGLTGNKATAYLAHPCHLDNQVKNPVVLPATNTIYDLRACKSAGGFQTSNGITFVLNSDVAFFSNSIMASNQLLVKSGDGNPHKVWYLVPDGGIENNGVAECTTRSSTGYTPGNISFSNQTDIQSPIQMFVYTPCSAYISNNTAIIGQIYGNFIQTSNNFHLLYTGMGIPGVDLGGTPTTAPAGYAVEIVNMRELKN